MGVTKHELLATSYDVLVRFFFGGTLHAHSPAAATCESHELDGEAIGSPVAKLCAVSTAWRGIAQQDFGLCRARIDYRFIRLWSR